MNKIIILPFVILILLQEPVIGQNEVCETSIPFCTGITYTYPAGTTDSAQPGAYYGCLEIQSAPAWFHMAVENPGNITIYMYSTPPVDIDFICWGPFSDPFSPCVEGLTSGSAIDCSYSPNPTEFCIIPGSQAGDYYILLITNYSKENTDITFLQSSGSGTLDCDIETGIFPGFDPVADNAILKVYPNPVKDHLFIDYSGIGEEPASLEIINSLGVSVPLSGYSPDMPGITSIKIPGLPAGIYLLRISFRKEVMNKLIIISE